MKRECILCKKQFNTWPSKIRTGRGKFCSRKCKSLSERKPSFCNFCKNKFNDKAGDGIKFCSKECKMKGSFGYRVRRWIEERKNKPHPKKGKIGIYKAWNKGLKLPYKPRPSQVGKISKEKNPNWKGGITPKNVLIRHSPKYREWRSHVFNRDEYTCQICGKIGGDLEADHIRPFSLYKRLRFSINNGRTLCKVCHKRYGWKPYAIKKWAQGK